MNVVKQCKMVPGSIYEIYIDTWLHSIRTLEIPEDITIDYHVATFMLISTLNDYGRGRIVIWLLNAVDNIKDFQSIYQLAKYFEINCNEMIITPLV